MFKYLVIVSGLFALLVLSLIPGFLGPDDLAGCAQPTLGGRCDRADVIIAISGGDTSARTATAISLFEAGWANKLIFSGAAEDTSGPSNATTMKRQAETQGVPASAILTDDTSRNTEQNAANAAVLVRQLGAKRIILVTSVYHQRRAYMEFQAKLGPGVTIVNRPADVDDGWTRYWWITPNGWWLAGGELTKIAYLILQGIPV